MKLCKDCKNRGQKHNCKLYGSTSSYAERCKDFKPQKQTNADLIRSMNDEELAVTIMCPNETGMANIECNHSDGCNCRKCCLKWLQSESEDER